MVKHTQIWRIALDKRDVAGTILMELSKVFYATNQYLFVTKLYAYGFDITFSKFCSDLGFKK